MAINFASSLFSSQRRSALSSKLFSFILPAVFCLSVLPCAYAQNGVGNTTSTPIPGVPHDYIFGANEIVNPANGALSIRIKQPAPPERGYNWPKYAFMYDSNLTYTLIPTWQPEQIGNENTQVLTKIQYSYNPLAFIVPISSLYTTVSACIQNNQSSCVTYSCTYSYGYVFTDPDGGRHPLGLSVGVPGTQNTSNDCNEFSAQWGGNYTEGGDENYKATWSGGVVDLHGNHPAIEDTNGNLLNSTGRTAPRPVPDTTTNGTAAFTRVYNATAQSSGTGCNFGTQITPTPPSQPGTQSVPVVASVTLPNNEKYTFLYDQTYGLLTRMIYPTGASVTYIWSPVINAEGVQWQAPPAIGTETGSGGTCAFRHDWFAITSRVVNDGTQNTQEQDFYYSTQWPTGTAGYQWLSKSTAVITKDLLKNTSFRTTYQYSPAQSPRESYANWEDLGYVPVESSITYNDTNGNLLRTVTKVWGTPDLMIAECETLPGGQTSGKFYTYAAYTPFQNGSVLNGAAGASNLPTDVAEFDYGTVSSSCTKPSSLPMRETVTNYQAFGNTPLFAGLPSIEDRPSSVQVYGSVNGVRTLLQETDYLYDGTTPPTAVTPTPLGHDETNYGSNSTAPRGNPTTVTRKCFVGSQSCTNSVTTYTYDTTGQVLSVTDANQNTTNYIYADSYTSDDGTPPGNTNAYVTKIVEPVTNGVAHTSTFQYGYEDGKLRSKTDENGQPTNYCYVTGGYPGGCPTTNPPWDPFFRLTGVNYPDKGQATFTYNDAGLSPSVQTTTLINASGLAKTSVTVADGLGRLAQTQLTSDSPGTTYTVTTYDGMGQPYFIYNPTRCSTPTTNCGETTWGYMTHNHDALNRTTSVVEQDGSTVTTTYDQTNPTAAGTCTTVTDEVGNSRQSCSDALGRVTSVWEDPAHLNYETDYTYDALSNLLSVAQKGSNSSNARVRSFTYDSLSRLISATNPESGTIGYSYFTSTNALCSGDPSAVCTKTAPLPNQTSSSTSVTTTYTYDALNRLTSRNYTEGTSQDPYTPEVRFGYDAVRPTGCTVLPPADTDAYPIGRQTSMCDGSGATTWTHDPMGRVAQERRAIGPSAVSHYIYYTYNLDGSLSVLQTPPMKTLNYSYSSAGRATQLLDSTDNINFATSAVYTPPGGLAGETLGSASGFAGINLSDAYNNRLQPVQLYANSPSGTILNLCYDYHFGLAFSSPYCSFSASVLGNNGNVASVINNRDTNRTQNFAYDSLNRITSGQSSGSGSISWGENYNIDAWSNLYSRTGVTGKANTEPLACLANTNNQLTSCSKGYDAAGNLMSDGLNSYIFDAENRLVWTNSSPSYRYVYDGNGQRVEKCQAATATTACPTSGTTGTLYWRGTGSDTLAETDLGGNDQEEYIFFNGQRIARRDTTSTGATIAVHYYFSDHLGSTSLVTNATGTLAPCGSYSVPTGEEESDYYPYGGEIVLCNSVPQHYKFTGKERDAESGLDMFGARYYGSSLARFVTPDWAAKPIAVPYANYGNPQSLNLYAYVENNPTTTGDPDGHGDAGTFCNAECRARYAQYAAEHPVAATLEPIAEFGTIPTAAIGGGAAWGSILLRNLLGLGLATAPRTVPLITGAIEGLTPGQNLTLGRAEALGVSGIEKLGESGFVGSLENGARISAGFERVGDTLGVNISNIQSAARGSINFKALESGAENLAKSEGASSLTITATNVTNSRLAQTLEKAGYVAKELTDNFGRTTINYVKKICTATNGCQ